jgi:tetratricopeptide (TPR) repeat protein
MPQPHVDNETDVAPPPPFGGNPMRLRGGRVRRVVEALFLLFAVMLAYSPALTGGFLLDDSLHITPDSLRSLNGLWRIWFELGAAPQYYPVLHTAFWLESNLWANAVLGYHICNLLQHAASAWLVLVIMRKLALRGAWLGAFIFALHPICSESVAWISEQKNTLSTLLFLSSFAVYIHFDQRRQVRFYFLASVLYLLALLSKTVCATLPGVLLVVLWYFKGKLHWKRDVLALFPWLLVGAGMGLLSAWMERTYYGAYGQQFALSLSERCIIAGSAIWFYLRSFFWPDNLSFIYPKWDLSSASRMGYIASLGIVMLVGVSLLLAVFRRQRGPIAALLCYIGMLFPTLGFLNIAYYQHSFVADHFQYPAVLALIVPLAFVLTTTTARSSLGSGHFFRWIAVVLVGFLGVFTWRRAHVYRDAETLYRDTIARNPNAWVAHNNLAKILLEQGSSHPHIRSNDEQTSQIAEAISHFSSALRANPQSEITYNNLGSALARIPGRMPEAIEYYMRALKLRPDYPEAHNNLANALSQSPNRINEAIEHYRLALKKNPGYIEALNGLAMALSRDPRTKPEALRTYRRLIELAPNDTATRNNFGLFLAQSAPLKSEAIAQFRKALEIDPSFVPAHFNLANELADSSGRIDDAIDEYHSTLRLDPNHAKAHCNLGGVLLSVPGRSSEGITHLEHAVRINPELVEAQFNLASALSQLPERKQDAIQHLSEALRLAPGLKPAQQLLEQLQRSSP